MRDSQSNKLPLKRAPDDLDNVGSVYGTRKLIIDRASLKTRERHCERLRSHFAQYREYFGCTCNIGQEEENNLSHALGPLFFG